MPDVLTYDLQPRAASFTPPPGSCDSHVHVFGPRERFPYAHKRGFTPVDAPKESLFALHRVLGIERCVIVQTALHGFDNRVVEDAIEAGEGRYLGIALVPADVPDAELARLAGAGFRGVRFNFMAHLPGTPVEDVIALTRRLAPLGLHLQVHFESAMVHGLGPILARSAVPVVIDHIGRVDAAQGPQHADFIALRALLRNPLFRVKVSGVDRIATQDSYPQGVALARILVEEFPERCFWGSDWPHPNHTHVPDDAALVELLPDIAPDAGLRELLLVRNPAAFYRFEPLRPA
ncbi:amidohydrolase family protein [Xylophilus rhododendri]|uniref:Amidohydrolase family protein n=1 Tax=Xylophilus rhododendri TaxID=2697032 RepID=A0A857J694_9BURK|nr:amidohydrolase family protein [Xylophilus rhododendri]QHI98542.1 amidohydrolase family protein [Xylophilus rhododendri]